MVNTFCFLNIHCIFSTKERVPMLNPELRERLWPFLGRYCQTKRYPGTSYLATIMLSLRDKIHSSAEALLKLTLIGTAPYTRLRRIPKFRLRKPGNKPRGMKRLNGGDRAYLPPAHRWEHRRQRFAHVNLPASDSLPMVIGNSFNCGIESLNDERAAAVGYCNE